MRPNPIYLRDSSIYIFAVISAGIDLSRALVKENYRHEEALKVARSLAIFLVRPDGQD